MWIFRAQVLMNCPADKVRRMTLRQVKALWDCYCHWHGIKKEEDKTIDDY